MLNRDFREFVELLAAHGVESLVVGGFAIDDVRFEDAWPRRLAVTVAGVEPPVIHVDDFRTNKRATGRLRDLADLDDLDRDAD